MEKVHFDFKTKGFFKIFLNGERVCAPSAVKNQAQAAVKKFVYVKVIAVISAMQQEIMAGDRAAAIS